MSNSSQCTVQVDLRIYDPADVQSAAYNLLADYEFDLHTPEGTFVGVTIWPVGESGPLPPNAVSVFQRELTRVAMERQAHNDHRHLRSWFAVAAMATDVSAESVLSELEQDLAGSAIDVPAAECTCTLHGTELGESLRYLLSADCPIPVIVRALSRLQDVSESVLEGYDHLGRLSLIVRLAPGVEQSWWEDRFRSLLTACADGGLPALYPPAFSLDELRA